MGCIMVTTPSSDEYYSEVVINYVFTLIRNEAIYCNRLLVRRWDSACVVADSVCGGRVARTWQLGWGGDKAPWGVRGSTKNTTTHVQPSHRPLLC